MASMDRNGSTAASLSAPARGITVLAVSTAMWIMTSTSAMATVDRCRAAVRRRARSVPRSGGRRCTIHEDTRHRGAAVDVVFRVLSRIDTNQPIGYRGHMGSSSFRKMWLLLPLFCACAFADESADRTAIARTIAALNEIPQRADLFTADASGLTFIPELSRDKPVTVQLQPPGEGTKAPAGRPTVTISHEPWGEATLNFPNLAIMVAEYRNPRVSSANIRFVTPDVALTEGSWTYLDDKGSQTTPLVFLMKREPTTWKIAAVFALPQK